MVVSLALGLTAAAAAGCARPAGERAADPDPADAPDRLRQQAREALARWDKALGASGDRRIFAPVGELTGQVGNWEPDRGDNKAALATGLVVAPEGVLPAGPGGTGEVRWADGTVQSVPVISATQALGQLRAAAVGTGDCPGCTALEVTGARLSTVQIQTTRGPATVPAWEFTLRGSAVRVTRVAVDPAGTVTVVPPSWNPYHAPGGLAIQSASTTVGTRVLTVTFTGSPGPGSVPCGIDYTGEAVESASAVVVIVLAHPHGGGGAGEACNLIGAPRSTTVELAQPLGERAVLEVQQGMPVPVTIGKP
jgi:hypothetical protein